MTDELPTIEEFERFIEHGEASPRLQALLEAGDSACLDQLDRMRRNNALLDELLAAGPGDEIDLGEALVGEIIGGFRLKRVIASGGMGVVYEAQQEQPRRTVALKVMRAGLSSRSALRRFEYEAQLLARLRHVGVAQVFEAGTHDDGRARVPWFAMEYIPGARDLVSYAQRKGLTIDERLALMAKVCEAVQHGHQKGIIHRDLKPANILVDTAGQPKVIDFGVARATDSDLALTAMQTNVGQLIGTLQYMSPEQCEADPHDLDVRSDVYALGVVLYELLTGQLPYSVDQKTVIESARMICEEPARRPSSVDTALRGDVETIVLTALEKDRDRRYQSAADLAADIGRHLRREGIQARRASALYRAKMFVRRNTAVVVAVVGLVVVLAGALVVTAGLLHETREALAQSRDMGDNQRQTSDLTNEMLSYANARGTDGGDITVAEVLRSAEEGFEDRFAGDMRTEAAARTVLGRAYTELGRFDDARTHLRRAHEIHGVLTDGGSSYGLASSKSNLAALAMRQRDYTRAIELFGSALRIFESLSGVSEVHVADHYNNLGTAHAYRYRDESAQGGAGDPADLRAADDYYARASEIYEAMGSSEWVAQIKNNHGGLLAQLGKFDEAERYLSDALRIRRRIYGDSHRKVAGSANNLGRLYFLTGKSEQSEALLREALEIRRRVLGDEHIKTAESAVSYALVLEKLGVPRWSEARELVEGAMVVLDGSGSARERDGRALLERLNAGGNPG